MKRRTFLSGMALGLSGMGLSYAKVPTWTPQPRITKAASTLSTARNLIFILLDGAPSHIDTFDLKLGSYTPDSLGAQDLGGFLWPTGTMPMLAQRSTRFSLVRSLQAVEAVHSRAVYHVLTAHRQNNALIKEIPHFASVLSSKFAAQRQPHETLPSVMLIGQNPAGNGYLPVKHLGLSLTRSATIPNLAHPFDFEADRMNLLDNLLATSPESQNSKAEHLVFQKQARQMMGDPDLTALLSEDPDAGQNRQDNSFLSQCSTAVKVLAANKGTRVMQLEQNGWDHHLRIYDTANLPTLSRELDQGLAFLLDELSALPATGGPGTLLDETLIVAMGEFGRTIGPLNNSAGRDHFPNVLSAFVAGGGVKGGRIIGRTDSFGGSIVDPGWSHRRFMTIDDMVATIYSALGIDWTEKVSDTPSGRIFELVDTTRTGEIYPIEPLFV